MATTEYDVIFDKLAEDVFPYLAELRNNRDINMAMMAPSMIAEDFGIDKYTARN